MKIYNNKTDFAWLFAILLCGCLLFLTSCHPIHYDFWLDPGESITVFSDHGNVTIEAPLKEDSDE